MQSDVKNSRLMFIWAIAFASSLIASCNLQSKDNNHNNRVDSYRLKALVDKYNKGKDVFTSHCITCHHEPDKDYSEQPLFEDLFGRVPYDYVVNYISDSKKLKQRGDKYARYAIELSKARNLNIEHTYKDILSDTELDNLMVYLEVVTHEKHPR
ncbi:MAG: c-type cytochrome [Chitinophagaceae bacterium]